MPEAVSAEEQIVLESSEDTEHETIGVPSELTSEETTAFGAPAVKPALIASGTMAEPNPHRAARATAAVLAVVFLLTTLGASFVALKQRDSSLQWRQNDQRALALSATLETRNGQLSRSLAQVNGSITSLNSQNARLNGQIKSLHAQLAAANKAKANTSREACSAS